MPGGKATLIGDAAKEHNKNKKNVISRHKTKRSRRELVWRKKGRGARREKRAPERWQCHDFWHFLPCWGILPLWERGSREIKKKYGVVLHMGLFAL